MREYYTPLKNSKRALLVLLLLTALSLTSIAQNEFITTWQTTTASESITIPTVGTGYNYTVDWGDGNSTSGHTANSAHTYASEGTYTVSISGDFPRIYFNNAGDKDKIKTIEQWGDIAWTSMGNAFKGCTNLASSNGVPNLTSVTNMDAMFEKATSFNSDLSGWNVSSVTSMYAMFFQASTFNGDLSGWNVSIVGNMYGMFYQATSFDQSLANWDISSAFNMADMLTNSAMSTTNYDNTLIGWAALTTPPSNIALGSTGITYCNGEAARTTLTDTYNWTFLGDALDCSTIPPSISSLSPGTNTTGVPVDANLVITYDEAVIANTGNYELRLSSGPTIETFPVGSANVQIVGNVVTINPTADMAYNTNYRVFADADVVQDVDNNGTVALSGPTWAFTTVDVPEIIDYYPAQSETDVAVDDSYYLEFDIELNTSSAAELVVKNYATDEIIEVVSIANQSSVFDIYLEPNSALPYSTKVYVTAQPAGSITAVAGGGAFVGLDDKDDWFFTTEGEPNRPVISALSPQNNATDIDISTDFTITFDVDLYVSSDVTLEIHEYGTDDLVESIAVPGDYYDADGIITVSTSADLEYSTHYYVVLGGTGHIEDYNSTGDFLGLVGKDEWNFTTLKVDQTITIETIADKLTTDTAFDVVATTTSGLALSYAIAGPATINGTTITLDGVGMVTVTVSQAGDANYNAAADEIVSFNVIDSSDPCDGFEVVLTSSVNNMCFGESLGSIDITVTGGTGSYSHSWSNGETSEDLSGLAVGTYTVTVTDDDASCEATLEVTITEPTLIEITSTTTDVVGGNDGTADITVTGGTSAYTYSWSNGDDTEDLADVAAGTYTVTVTDANSCSVSQAITIGDIITGVSELATPTLQIYPNPVSDYITIEGEFTQGKVEVQLINNNGQQMMQKQFDHVTGNKVQLHLTPIKNGQYLVIIKANNQQSVQRINIKH